MVKKKKNGLFDDVADLTGSGVTLGVGSGVVAKLGGGSVGSGVQKSFGTAGSMLGVVGAAKFGGHALRALPGYKKKKGKKKKGLSGFL